MSTRARTLNELKVSIEAAQLACPETKDETHLLSLPLFNTLAKFDPADQRVRSGMSVRTKMLCDGKTGRNLVDALEVFTKSFPQSTPSLADVNGRAATAGDAVNEPFNKPSGFINSENARRFLTVSNR